MPTVLDRQVTSLHHSLRQSFLSSSNSQMEIAPCGDQAQMWTDAPHACHLEGRRRPQTKAEFPGAGRARHKCWPVLSSNLYSIRCQRRTACAFGTLHRPQALIPFLHTPPSNHTPLPSMSAFSLVISKSPLTLMRFVFLREFEAALADLPKKNGRKNRAKKQKVKEE